jgi:hypothetical protein
VESKAVTGMPVIFEKTRMNMVALRSPGELIPDTFCTMKNSMMRTEKRYVVGADVVGFAVGANVGRRVGSALGCLVGL